MPNVRASAHYLYNIASQPFYNDFLFDIANFYENKNDIDVWVIPTIKMGSAPEGARRQN